jgi:hypothetical protein
VVVALFVDIGSHVASDGFVEVDGPLKAGHATQSQCSADSGTLERRAERRIR